jgi:DNA-binding CsgD family transcriptional regulator
VISTAGQLQAETTFAVQSHSSLYAVLGRRRWQALSERLGLSRRQADVARLMADGHTYESIADEAGISVNTVRMHMRGLFKKLDAHDRVSVVVRLVAADQVLQSKRDRAD